MYLLLLGTTALSLVSFCSWNLELHQQLLLNSPIFILLENTTGNNSCPFQVDPCDDTLGSSHALVPLRERHSE